MEHGEPSVVLIKSLSELSTVVIQTACIQAMHEQGPYDVQLSATEDFAMLKPLIRGAPAILKPYLVEKRDEIKRNIEYNKKQGNNAPKQLPAWVEIMHSTVNYSREMGWDPNGLHQLKNKA